MKTKPFANFLGVNNRLQDFALRVATSQLNGQYLRTADNVDVDNAGKLRRRNGTALVQAMSAPHSLFMIAATTGFIVRSNALYAITLPVYTETLLKVLSNDNPMSYEAIGADVYASNGTDRLRIHDGVAYPMALPTPAAPTITTTTGALLAGRYQVVVSYSNNVTGEEGGVSSPGWHEITDTGGLEITLPAPVAGATHVHIYLSGANGAAPMLLDTVNVGVPTYTSMSLPTGREAPQRFEAPLPAGRLFVSNGKLCSIVGNAVYVGLPYRYGYYLPLSGYIPFPAPVSIAIENQGGTYIAADKTYFFPGDLGDIKGQIPDVLPYGAVPGTEFCSPDKSVVGWFGAKGLVLAGTSGDCQAIMNENIDLTAPAAGHSVIVDSDGYDRVVSCGWCVNLENKAATSYSDWAFTSVSGKYGTKADGFYALSGGAAANATIGLGKENFDSEAIKHLPAVYAMVACAEPLELTVRYVDEQDIEQEYTFTTRGSSAAMTMQRFDTAKGMRANWFDLTIKNQDGAYFSLASVSFEPAASARRI